MRYIITKNGRILDLAQFANIIVINPENILKEADTIKELCDIFVVERMFWGNLMPEYVYDFDTFRKIWSEEHNPWPLSSYSAPQFYGAIKKDNCLVKVAEMNNEGELRLPVRGRRESDYGRGNTWIDTSWWEPHGGIRWDSYGRIKVD